MGTPGLTAFQPYVFQDGVFEFYTYEEWISQSTRSDVFRGEAELSQVVTEWKAVDSFCFQKSLDSIGGMVPNAFQADTFQGVPDELSQYLVGPEALIPFYVTSWPGIRYPWLATLITLYTQTPALIQVERTEDSGSLSDGRFLQDGNNNQLYFRLSGDNPLDSITQVFFLLCVCSNVPPGENTLVLEERLYELRLSPSGFASISMESESIFYGTFVLSDSRIALENGDGFFDEPFYLYIWKDRRFGFYHGDGNHRLHYLADKFIGTFSIYDRKIHERQLSISLLNAFTIFQKKLPPREFPIIYGKWKKIRAAFLEHDTLNNWFEYRICEGDSSRPALDSMGPFFISFDNGSTWIELLNTLTGLGQDPTEGTFNLSVNLWLQFPELFPVDETPDPTKFMIAVDCERNISGPGDFIWKLFREYGGASDDNLDHLALQKLDADFPQELKIAIGLNGNKETIANISRKLEQSIFGFVRQSEQGVITAGLLQPEESPLKFTEEELIDIDAGTEPGKVFNKVKILYDMDPVSGEYKEVEVSSQEAEALFHFPDQTQFETYLVNPSDAEGIGQIFILFSSKEPREVNVHLAPRGLIAEPFRTVALNKKRGWGEGGTYQSERFIVRGTDRDFLNVTARLRLNDFFGLDEIFDHRGFWMPDSAPNWSTATGEEREVSGFWCNDNGLADPGDPDSQNRSLWWR